MAEYASTKKKFDRIVAPELFKQNIFAFHKLGAAIPRRVTTTRGSTWSTTRTWGHSTMSPRWPQSPTSWTSTTTIPSETVSNVRLNNKWSIFQVSISTTFYYSSEDLRSANRHRWLDSLFALLGSVHIKTVFKHVGAISVISPTFHSQLIRKKCFVRLFSTYSLAMYFFPQKNIVAQKLIIKCWWNWLQQN